MSDQSFLFDNGAAQAPPPEDGGRKRPRRKSAAAKTDPDLPPDLKFEAALARLETLVAEMEKGQLPLEENLARYEEAAKLSRFCAAQLRATEKKVEMLLKAGEGEDEWQDFDSGDET